MKSLSSILERCAAVAPDRRAYTFLIEGQQEGRVLTYAELRREAGQCAWRLRERVKAGDRVLLVHEDSLDFIVGFMACVLARVIAVPVPPLDVSRLKWTLPRMQSVIADCDAAAVLASASIRDRGRDAFASERDLRHLPWIVTGDSDDAPQLSTQDGREDDVALLQYTSGSTSAPKGVMVTHANLLDNLAMLQRSFAYSVDSCAVTWMPYFHDYGLIDGLLEPLFVMAPCYVIPPVAFVKRPWRWLEAISTYRATHMHGPNFAYQLCLDRAVDRVPDSLDLSSVVVAACGAEPIRRDTVERFIGTFSRFGFRPEAFAPGYGLAEATLIVSAKPTGTLHRMAFLAPEALERRTCVDVSPDTPRARAVFSCGVPSGEFPLRIVDPETCAELPDNEVGELWVASPAVAAGYWNCVEETEAAFHARTATGTGPMLRTGDLAFLRDGEIYITGRLKDLLIFNGHNHYPQDIEQTVEAADPAIRSTCVAAFAVECPDGEGLVIVAELSSRHADYGVVIAAIRSAVSLQHEVACEAIVLWPKGSVFKTSSGKLQRRACRAAYLSGQFTPLAEWRGERPRYPEAPLPEGPPPLGTRQSWEGWLRALMASRTRVVEARVDASQPFSSFGLSSLEAVEIAAYIEEQTHRRVPVTALWEYPSIRAFAEFLASGDNAHAAPAAAEVSNDDIAVIGMACDFPGGGNTPDAFWQTIRAGTEAMTPQPDRFRGRRPVAPAGYLPDMFRFDAAFFGISDAEAISIDPQQRRLLETAWHALEDARVLPEALAGSDAGVFVGVSATDYAAEVYHAAGGPDRFAATGTSAAIIANRLSYFLDTHGPSLTVDTACSASLVAVHQACQAIRAGDCGLAIAAGVNAILSGAATASLEDAQMLSATGQCRPFDAAADGYVRGEGCGVVLLKRLSAARLDGNRVLAVIRGSAVVQDGRSNGLSAPNGAAQRHAIRRALAQARISADQVEYVEAHGTGTPLGDPIELHALADCYGHAGTTACHVGSVKGVIGHLEGAAGIAGLIKAILVMTHETIPMSAQLRTPNPRASIADTRLRLPVAAVSWPASGTARVAAVSSFGFGGTLAHVIVSDDPLSRRGTSTPVEAAAPEPQLLVLSARDSVALRELAARYARLCASSPNLFGLCASAALTRTVFSERAAFTFTSRQGLVAQLSSFAESGAAERCDPPEGWETLFSPVAPSAAWALPLYPFGGRDYRIDASVGSPILDALATGRVDDAMTQLRAHQADGPGQALGLQQMLQLVSTLHRSQVDGTDKTEHANTTQAQAYIVDWIAADVPQVPSSTASPDRRCLLIGDAGDDTARLAAAIDRRQGLRRVASLTHDDVDDGVPLIVFQGRAGADEAPDEAALRVTRDLVGTLRRLESAGRKAELWVITQGVAPCGPGNPARLDGAAVWGAGKCAALELPHLWGGMVDLPAVFNDVDADRAMNVLMGGGVDDQVALRDGRAFVPRLIPAPPPDRQPTTTFRDDAVYWIAGGTGALGQHTLRYMLEGGARHIVISGRGGGLPEPVAGVQFLRADVRSREDCARVLAAIDARGLPLAGVIHAAGTASECPIEALTPERLHDVAASKVTGAWNLHVLTQDRPLDLFVCFSSIAALWGSAGQAHYAAGNHFLDTLCAYRHTLGLPGLAMAWGPWSGGGLVTESVQARLSTIGLDPVAPSDALAILAASIHGRHACVAGVNVRWASFGAAITARRPSPLLASFLSAADANVSRPVIAWQDIDTCTAHQLHTRIRDHVRAVVAEYLGAGRQPESDRGLFDMGLDSLAVVAIRGRLSSDFGVIFSNAEMFNHPTINALTSRLARMLRPGIDERLSDAVEPTADTLSQRELLERIASEFDALSHPID